MEPLNYYLSYLGTYLTEHHFLYTADFDPGINMMADADRAAEAFDNSRREGLSVYAAQEIAIKEMMSQVGESKFDALLSVLEEICETYDLNVPNDREIILMVMNDTEIFFGFPMLRYGLHPQYLEDNRLTLTDRVKASMGFPL